MVDGAGEEGPVGTRAVVRREPFPGGGPSPPHQSTLVLPGHGIGRGCVGRRDPRRQTPTGRHAQSLQGISTIARGCQSAAPATPGFHPRKDPRPNHLIDPCVVRCPILLNVWKTRCMILASAFSRGGGPGDRAVTVGTTPLGLRHKPLAAPPLLRRGDSPQPGNIHPSHVLKGHSSIAQGSCAARPSVAGQ